MARKLTSTERAICDQFEALLSNLEVDGVQHISATRIGAAFVHGRSVHISSYRGSMADRIEEALAIFAVQEPDAKTAKQTRIDELRRELADLEQVPA